MKNLILIITISIALIGCKATSNASISSDSESETKSTAVKNIKDETEVKDQNPKKAIAIDKKSVVAPKKTNYSK